MFNKAIRKFTNICKASFEQQIAREISNEEQVGKQLA